MINIHAKNTLVRKKSKYDPTKQYEKSQEGSEISKDEIEISNSIKKLLSSTFEI